MNSPHNRLLAGVFSVLLVLSACGSTAASDAANEESETTATVASLPEQTSTEEATADEASSAEDSELVDESVEELTAEEAQLKFEQCLLDAGIDSPFAGTEGESIGASEDGAGIAFELDEEDFEAFEKCNEILSESFGEFTPSPEQEAIIQDAQLEFDQCMTDKGFDVSGGASFELGEGVSIDDLQVASDECSSVFDVLSTDDANNGEDS